jgi:hypothetical protein
MNHLEQWFSHEKDKGGPENSEKKEIVEKTKEDLQFEQVYGQKSLEEILEIWANEFYSSQQRKKVLEYGLDRAIRENGEKSKVVVNFLIAIWAHESLSWKEVLNYFDRALQISKDIEINITYQYIIFSTISRIYINKLWYIDKKFLDELKNFLENSSWQLEYWQREELENILPDYEDEQGNRK